MSSPASSVAVPVLETERLRLRGHRLEDFPHSATMWADPIVTRYLRLKPFSVEECWSRLLRYVGHWALLGFGYWLVEEQATGSFIGECGFADYKREMQPPLAGMPEAGWVLASHAHGKGYASEALRAILAWSDVYFGPMRTACIIHPQNVASVRIAEKNGYRRAGSATYMSEEVMLYVREAPK
jgi:RimJ/RimL family protein N-acetyltransferase